MQEVVGSIPFASTSCDQDFCRGGRPVEGPRNGCRARSVRDLSWPDGAIPASGRDLALLAISSRPVAKQALHPLRRFRDDRADPVPVVPVDGLRIIPEQVGHLLDRRSRVEEERHDGYLYLF